MKYVNGVLVEGWEEESIDRMVSWLRCLLDVSHSAGNTRENLIFFKPRMSRRKRFNLSRLAISRGLPCPFSRGETCWCLMACLMEMISRANLTLGRERIDRYCLDAISTTSSDSRDSAWINVSFFLQWRSNNRKVWAIFLLSWNKYSI